MGFLETFNSIEILENYEGQDSDLTEVYLTDIINDDDSNDGFNNTILFEEDYSETENSITYEIVEHIDYSEQLFQVTEILDKINLMSTITVCVFISFIVFKFMKIRKEGDI